MKRNLIRFMGTLLSVCGMIATRVSSAASTPDCVIGSQHINTDTRVVYLDRVCTTKVDGYVLNDPRLSHLWAGCQSGDQEFTESGCINGICTSSGLFCTGSGYFYSGLNCRESLTGSPCYYGTGQYRRNEYSDMFAGCVSGAYQEGAAIITTPASSGYGWGTGTCIMCSGLKYETGGLVTFTPGNGQVSNEQFYWDGDYGANSCRAYSLTSITDSKGTFVVPSGCAYVGGSDPNPSGIGA